MSSGFPVSTATTATETVSSDHQQGRNPETDGLSWPMTIGVVAIHLIAIGGAIYYFSPTAILVAWLLNILTGTIGISMGFHRLFSHRSYRVPKALEYVIAVLGTLAMQGGIIKWVAHHRIHHADSDQARDPHSRNHGFWWSHILWIVYIKNSPYFDYDWYRQYAADLDRDPFYRFLDKRWKLINLALIIALYSLGGMPWVIYGFFVRIVIGLHTTFLVNSAAHTWGRRPFSTEEDTSTVLRAGNLWWLNIIELGSGEAWHHNHHVFPQSAQLGLRWWQVDVSYHVIRALEAVGVATQVRRPQLDRGRGTQAPSV